MAPTPRILVEEGGLAVLEENDESDDGPDDDFGSPAKKMKYYESDKALGVLFRSIDEKRFLTELHHSQARRIQGAQTDFDVMDRLWEHVNHSNMILEWEHQCEIARRTRYVYEQALLRAMRTYAPSPHATLTEHEMFAGTILGREGGASGGRLRDLIKTMRERFEEILRWTVGTITNGDEGDDDRDEEALPRAIACLRIAMTEDGLKDPKIGQLRSFKYIAAGVVFREMKRYGIVIR